MNPHQTLQLGLCRTNSRKRSMGRLVTIIILFLLIFIASAEAQEFENYRKDSLLFQSELLNRELRIDLMYPKAYDYLSDDARLPCLIIFDQQLHFTYSHLLSSIELMTINDQIPDLLVVGISFTPGERNWLTSSEQREGDVYTGIQRFEQVLHTELYPFLRKNFRASERIMIAGHSRTAYLVNYLLRSHPEEYAFGLAASGFFGDDFDREGLRQQFKSWQTLHEKPSWYFTAGSTLEEAAYRETCEDLRDSLYAMVQPAGINWRYHEFEGATHMANYMYSLPWALRIHFEPYSRMLDTWLFKKTASLAPADAMNVFASDLRNASAATGVSIYPQLAQIWYLARYYYHNSHPEIALQFWELGHRVFPKDYSFVANIASLQLELGNTAAAKEARKKAISLVNEDETLPQTKKTELISVIKAIDK